MENTAISNQIFIKVQLQTIQLKYLINLMHNVKNKKKVWYIAI